MRLIYFICSLVHIIETAFGRTGTETVFVKWWHGRRYRSQQSSVKIVLFSFYPRGWFCCCNKIHQDPLSKFFKMSQLADLQKFSLNLSSLSFISQSLSSLFLYGLLSLWCFSLVLVNYNFQASFNLKVIQAKNQMNCYWLASSETKFAISKSS